jgi:hypothetical protein
VNVQKKGSPTRLAPERLLKFGGGVGQPIDGEPVGQAALKQPSVPSQLSAIRGEARGNIAPDVRLVASKVAGNGASKIPACRSDWNQKRKAVTLPQTLPQQLRREARKAQVIPHEEVIKAVKEAAWKVDPNPGQFFERQLNHPKAKAAGKAGTLAATNGPEANSAYGVMRAAGQTARKYGEMLPIEGAPRPKGPFGCVVSIRIAGGHRVPYAVEPGEEQRPVVFEKLLQMNSEYAGEQVLSAPVSSEYRIRIREEDGLLVDKNDRPVNAEDAKFVLTEHGDWFMVNTYKNEVLHHSFFTNGGPVGMAGHMRVQDGRFVSYEARSGHYRPQQEHIDQFEKYLATTNLQGFERGKCLVRRQPVQSNVPVPLPDSPMIYGDSPQSRPAKPPEDYNNDAEEFAKDWATMQRLKNKNARPFAEPEPAKDYYN